MKNRIIKLFILLLILTLISGCSQKPEEVPSKESTVQPSPNQNVPEVPDAFMKEGWPTELVPDELPEYTQGNVVNSGEDYGTLYIKIRDTDQDKLGLYLNELEDDGWIIIGNSSEAQALKGLYTADFEWQGGGEMLQIAIYAMDEGSWPSSDIPPDVLKPQSGILVGSIDVLNTMEGMWYFNYTYDGIDEEEAHKYMEMLMENGWEGDTSQLYKSFEWNGHQYGATIEIYETIETRTTFTCNFYYSD